MTENEKHLLHYLILAVGLGFISLMFCLFRHEYYAQIFFAGLGSAFYVLWGIIHHALEKRLTRAIYLEYLLIGALIFFLIVSALTLS